MTRWLHPWIGEARLVFARRAALRKRRWLIVALIVLLGASAAWAAHASAAATPNVFDAALRLFAAWPLAMLGVVASLAYAATRRRVLALSDHLQFGWWAAAPVDPRSVTRTLTTLALTGAALGLLAGASALMLMDALAHMRGTLDSALPVMAAGMVAGTSLGLSTALRQRRTQRGTVRREGVRKELFALPWFDDPQLPHLFDWQRREALLRWRLGGQFPFLIGALILGIPSGVSTQSAAGLLLSATAALWLNVVLRASVDVAMAAQRAMAASPFAARRFVIAALRYPAFAGVCALMIAMTGALLMNLSWRSAFIWLAVFIVASTPIWRRLATLLHHLRSTP